MRVIFFKSISRHDDRTVDIFSGSPGMHLVRKVRKDGVAQNYRVANSDEHPKHADTKPKKILLPKNMSNNLTESKKESTVKPEVNQNEGKKMRYTMPASIRHAFDDENDFNNIVNSIVDARNQGDEKKERSLLSQVHEYLEKPDHQKKFADILAGAQDSIDVEGNEQAILNAAVAKLEAERESQARQYHESRKILPDIKNMMRLPKLDGNKAYLGADIQGADRKIGTVIPTDGGWLRIDKITKKQFSGASGIGYNYYANGKIVSDKVAQELWAKDKGELSMSSNPDM